MIVQAFAIEKKIILSNGNVKALPIEENFSYLCQTLPLSKVYSCDLKSSSKVYQS
jgi:hypothetical protein